MEKLLNNYYENCTVFGILKKLVRVIKNVWELLYFCLYCYA